ncbi:hypothetical protein BOTCAL_0171g00110 [Botryotinia calthae]|uniref:Uncharacterized protein n=1 Tax=Botryotinia calthae TaxID=38488 RepID=A0A4Y8D1N0_9HELO|nr:hypothetical protein BOTCAL_0171g00110 [Botryotinia calthae]
MSNLILLQVPHSPGPKHNRSSSVYSRNSYDSTFSAYTRTTLTTETCPTINRARESRLSYSGPCDGTVFYIYDKPLPPLPQEALVQKQKPLPPLPLNMSRRRSHQNMRGPMPEPRNDAIYYDEKEVYVHNPFSDEKVVLVESWDDKEKRL